MTDEAFATKPLRGYFSHHKCGTRWISQVLDGMRAKAGLKRALSTGADTFQGDIVAARQRSKFDLWYYINADYQFVRTVPDLAGFHVVRDPRDMIVSGYFSHAYSHSDATFPRLRHYRPYLLSLDKEAGLLAEIEFSGIYLYHLKSWNYDDPRILECRFEDIIADPVPWFGRFRDILDLSDRVTRPDIEQLCEDTSFCALSGGRRPGETNEHHHYRNGVPGDWRRHFTPRVTEEFKKWYAPLLVKLGYERDDNWA